MLQKVSYFVDTATGTSGGVKIPLSEVKFMHAHGNTNYIAAVCYLYRLAILQHDNLAKPITTVMENCKQHYGLDSDAANFTKLRKAVNIVCKGSIPTASYSGTAEQKAGKNRCLRILGMAMHVAGDAYAHKAIVPNYQAVKDLINRQSEQRFKNKNIVISTIQGKTAPGYITMSKLSSGNKSGFAISAQENSVHKDYADNPSFCPRRYQYGAQNVVETLLFQFSKKITSFGITSFYNYGATKNNIYQYRLDKYANQASGTVNPANLNWSAYSKG